MDSLLYKFKNLGRSEFGNFNVSGQTLRILQESEKTLNEVIKTSNYVSIPKKDQFKEVLINFYDPVIVESYFSNTTNVKMLCWALDYSDKNYPVSILDGGHLKTALSFIGKHFSSSCYSAIIFIVFSNWKNPNIDFLRKYLKNRLIEEQNNRPKIKFFQGNIDFICSFSGPIDWAKQTYISGIYELELFFERNPFISFVRGSSYFKLFLIHLFELTIEKSNINEREIWQKLLDFSKENYESNISKYLICLEITTFKNQITGSKFQDQIKNQAFDFIGDPNKVSLWKLPSSEFDANQIKIVESARIILNQWINETLIDLFFSKVVDDKSRKRFWSKYVPKMSTVDIFLSNQKIYEILNDERLKEGLLSRFGILSSSGSTSSILIFSIDDYRFVLAGSYSGGALYVHPSASSIYPKIEDIMPELSIKGKKLRIVDRNQFVHSYLPNLISEDNYKYYFENEGRMVHTGNWELRLDQWMKNKVR